jgi:hypothetical protein
LLVPLVPLAARVNACAACATTVVVPLVPLVPFVPLAAVVGRAAARTVSLVRLVCLHDYHCRSARAACASAVVAVLLPPPCILCRLDRFGSLILIYVGMGQPAGSFDCARSTAVCAAGPLAVVVVELPPPCILCWPLSQGSLILSHLGLGKPAGMHYVACRNVAPAGLACPLYRLPRSCGRLGGAQSAHGAASRSPRRHLNGYATDRVELDRFTVRQCPCPVPLVELSHLCILGRPSSRGSLILRHLGVGKPAVMHHVACRVAAPSCPACPWHHVLRPCGRLGGAQSAHGAASRASRRHLNGSATDRVELDRFALRQCPCSVLLVELSQPLALRGCVRGPSSQSPCVSPGRLRCHPLWCQRLCREPGGRDLLCRCALSRPPPCHVVASSGPAGPLHRLARPCGRLGGAQSAHCAASRASRRHLHGSAIDRVEPDRLTVRQWPCPVLVGLPPPCSLGRPSCLGSLILSHPGLGKPACMHHVACHHVACRVAAPPCPACPWHHLLRPRGRLGGAQSAHGAASRASRRHPNGSATDRVELDRFALRQCPCSVLLVELSQPLALRGCVRGPSSQSPCVSPALLPPSVVSAPSSGAWRPRSTVPMCPITPAPLPRRCLFRPRGPAAPLGAALRPSGWSPVGPLRRLTRFTAPPSRLRDRPGGARSVDGAPVALSGACGAPSPVQVGSAFVSWEFDSESPRVGEACLHAPRCLPCRCPSRSRVPLAPLAADLRPPGWSPAGPRRRIAYYLAPSWHRASVPVLFGPAVGP